MYHLSKYRANHELGDAGNPQLPSHGLLILPSSLSSTKPSIGGRLTSALPEAPAGV